MKIFLWASMAAALLLTLAAPALARDIDWTKTGKKNLTLFYPGVASWEFLTSDDHRLGAREIKQVRKDCRHCHLSDEGELDLKADEIAAGAVKMKRSHNPFEPEPVPGKKGVITATVQAAYDNDHVYIRVEWESKGTGARKRGPVEHAPDRVSLQINKGEKSFRRYGCFVACHNDLYSMPDSPTKRETMVNPYYGPIGRDDVRLYAYYAKRSWSDRVSQAQREKGLKGDGLIDLWTIVFDNGDVSPGDGWIFDDRIWENESDVAGTGSYSNSRYSAVFKRRLTTGKAGDVQIKEGDALTVGLAIHEDKTSRRKHYVSFPFTIGLGAGADVKAEKLK